jgi:hypothetical protein
MAEKEYRRLTRTRARSAAGIITISRSSLWLGKDHLLVIETSGYTESYKRFYFRDIQGIILWKTDRWKIWALVFVLLAGLCGLIAVLSGEPVAAWIFGILAGLLLLALGLDLAAGPTCRCQFRTAVQTEEFPSLNRLRRTRKVLDRVRPLIVAAQGALSPEELSARLQPVVATNIPAASSGGSASYIVDDPNAVRRIAS